jgi:cation diffusion facilitator CzcD-associated flavoprotein CzcO
VIVIGAGVSGILAAIRLQQYVPGVDLKIYEKNPALGGTWFENRYPGLACDIPSHVYQYTFEHNTQWSSFFSGGPEILKYVQSVATKYKVEKYITYNSRICEAVWDEEAGKWKVKVESEGEIKSEDCDVLFSASGVLNNWKWPDIAGLGDFKGKLLHSAQWDTEWYFSNSTVDLIVGIILESRLLLSDVVLLLFRFCQRCKRPVQRSTITSAERRISVILLEENSP